VGVDGVRVSCAGSVVGVAVRVGRKKLSVGVAVGDWREKREQAFIAPACTRMVIRIRHLAADLILGDGFIPGFNNFIISL
jgi:hypothetical protein